MYQFEDVKIRKFTAKDIPLKIQWINNAENHQFLHYDLPLEFDKTLAWYNRVKNSTNRFDAVIEYCGEPVGLVGLINIDFKNRRAEDYMVIGNTRYKRKGIGTKAGALCCLYGFEILKLNKIYAYIEVGNDASLRMDLKRGFNVEGFLRNDIVNHEGKFVNRYILGLFRENLFIPGQLMLED